MIAFLKAVTGVYSKIQQWDTRQSEGIVNQTRSRFYHIERMAGSESRPQPTRLPVVAST